MPTWLVHGFRWPRPLIRIHIILQNLEDAASEWLMAPETTASLINNFQTLYPEIMDSLSSLRFIEQYDPDDMVSKDQPYAYVCDQVHEVQLGVDIDEVRGQGVANKAWAALADLRDKIAPGEKVAWFVVVNGDVERWAPPIEDEEGEETETEFSPMSPTSVTSGTRSEEEGTQKSESKGFKKWLSNKARKTRSSKDLRGDLAMRPGPHSSDVPEVPSHPANFSKGQSGTPVPLPKLNRNARVPAGTAV